MIDCENSVKALKLCVIALTDKQLAALIQNGQCSGG